MILCPQLRRLAAGHARWLAELARGSAEPAGRRAARLVALWEGEILPHCRLEEDVLLPELARRLSEADAAVVFTLGDHVALRRLARELRAAHAAGRAPAVAALEQKIKEYVAFEAGTLLPALQEAIGCQGLAELATDLAGEPGAKHRVARRR